LAAAGENFVAGFAPSGGVVVAGTTRVAGTVETAGGICETAVDPGAPVAAGRGGCSRAIVGASDGGGGELGIVFATGAEVLADGRAGWAGIDGFNSGADGARLATGDSLDERGIGAIDPGPNRQIASPTTTNATNRMNGRCFTETPKPCHSQHKAEIRRREAADIWEDGPDISGADAEPFGERRTVLVDRSCWNPAAFV
jgi:hypothetical protein